MKSLSHFYDIAFIGHMCFDEVIPFQGEPHVAPGSAVLCGALAATQIGKKVVVVTRIAQKDEQILELLRRKGIFIHAIHVAETTYMMVIYLSANVDERKMIQQANAGFFTITDLPPLNAQFIHLAGITDQEFDLDFIRDLKAKGCRLSADMQSFVRQVDPVSRTIAFRDVPLKREIVHLLEMVKLDIVEARILTDKEDPEQAARMIEYWGCPEVVITQAEGVLALSNGQIYYEKFTNHSMVGRTGRGDTTFAAYLARRMDHDVAESLKFAAALASIKMETPGPFNGTLADVLARMQ